MSPTLPFSVSPAPLSCEVGHKRLRVLTRFPPSISAAEPQVFLFCPERNEDAVSPEPGTHGSGWVHAGSGIGAGLGLWGARPRQCARMHDITNPRIPTAAQKVAKLGRGCWQKLWPRQRVLGGVLLFKIPGSWRLGGGIREELERRPRPFPGPARVPFLGARRRGWVELWGTTPIPPPHPATGSAPRRQLLVQRHHACRALAAGAGALRGRSLTEAPAPRSRYDGRRGGRRR